MSYYVDVSKYQSTDVGKYASYGASGVIAQVTVGDSIVAPRCKEQLRSAKRNGMHRLMYHYACFGHDVNQAVREAKFACHRAKELGFKTIHIFCDWENADNDTSCSKRQNTSAILAFMNEVHKEGFTTGLYSSADLLRRKINTKVIVKHYGTCLWVASYPTTAAVKYADLNYFPSMDGVTMWQFTDNWCGSSTDASKVVWDPFRLKKIQKVVGD